MASATMKVGSCVHDAAAVTRDRLAREIQPALDAFPTSTCIALLDAHPVGGYKYRSPAFLEHCARLASAFPAAVTRYNAVVVLDLIQRSVARGPGCDLTSEIMEVCVANFARIVRNIDAGDIGHMQVPDDRFDKDLAAVSMRLLCGGARKFHLAYLPRRLVRRNPVAWARCAFRVGRHGTLYRMHVDSDDPLHLAEFNPEGWTRFCRRAASLVQRNPVRGLIGTTWFYDPALQVVSPHLAYLRALIMDHGGISFRMSATAADVANATKTSKTRRRLYESGAYHPVGYTLVWLRNDLLRWAGLASG